MSDESKKSEGALLSICWLSRYKDVNCYIHFQRTGSNMYLYKLGCHIRSFFKQIRAVLNSEFYFPDISFRANAWKPDCPTIHLTLPPRVGWDTRSVFKWIRAVLNSEFYFSNSNYCTNARKFRLSYYLHIVSERRDGFIPFPWELAWSVTQRASSRIWTLFLLFISYLNNRLHLSPNSSA